MTTKTPLLFPCATALWLLATISGPAPAQEAAAGSPWPPMRAFPTTLEAARPLDASRRCDPLEATHRDDVGPKPRPNGCGADTVWFATPRTVPQSVFGADFRPGCNRHDDCYGDPGATKAACDRRMLADHLEACRAVESPMKRLGCDAAASAYYVGVRVGGQGAYDRAQQDAARRAMQTGRRLDAIACEPRRRDDWPRTIQAGTTGQACDRTPIGNRRPEAVDRVDHAIAAARAERAESARKEALIGDIQAAGRRAREKAAR